MRLDPLVVACLILFLASPPLLAEESLDQRPVDVQIVRTLNHVKVVRPIILRGALDGTNRLFIVSQLGKIHVLADDSAQTEVFLDLQERVVYKDNENEEGLLGLAFHPQFKTNRRFYVYYSTTDAPHTSVVSEFTADKKNPNRGDAASERELLRVKQPFWNHNGGTLEFGPDGKLYIVLGDGGLAADPFRNGQNLATWFGSILRIDVDHRDPGLQYAVPKDNPFVGRDDARPEIWAYGLRNVWRLTFDRETGTAWAADVGQDLWEEINLIERGGNYGWNLRESMHPFGEKGVGPRDDLIDPIWEYSHDVGKSITGGHVYRGKKVPELAGAYLYADYVTGKIWALWYDQDSKRVVANRSIAGNILPVMSFGEDDRGEVYFMIDSGGIFTFASSRKDAGG